ncbi:MAG TPA: dephospho-CoA kinase, partial [Rhodothermales bacterium]|nr:dephospho-CoA kinase [Rhodothermales bacterium]
MGRGEVEERGTCSDAPAPQLSHGSTPLLLTLGVTGGIGAGKTTVCRILERLGARVFYADVEAKRLME